MEKVLVDAFIVPEESRAEFLDGAGRVQRFLKTLPGFVEGFLFERTDGESPYNVLTTAVWKDEDAFENAKGAVALEFKRQGYDPQETRRKLRIESVRSTYGRSPYE